METKEGVRDSTRKERDMYVPGILSKIALQHWTNQLGLVCVFFFIYGAFQLWFSVGFHQSTVPMVSIDRTVETFGELRRKAGRWL